MAIVFPLYCRKMGLPEGKSDQNVAIFMHSGELLIMELWVCRNEMWRMHSNVTDAVSLMQYLMRNKMGTDCHEWFIQYPSLEYDLAYLKRERYIYILKNEDGHDRAFVNSWMCDQI